MTLSLERAQVVGTVWAPGELDDIHAEAAIEQNERDIRDEELAHRLARGSFVLLQAHENDTFTRDPYVTVVRGYN